MKISSLILSIPPYISTSWENVLSLRVEGTSLVVDLVTSKQVKIPNLQGTLLEQVFRAHAQYMEKKNTDKEKEKGPSFFEAGAPFRLGLPGTMEPLENILQHNPDQASLPNLPEDVLKKITSIAKAVGLTLSENVLKAEPHCNCAYCQIARSLQNGSKEEEGGEEEVCSEDLSFKNWDIHQRAEKLYDVVNPLDTNECYQVFLGEPLGCTCGQKHCEHIKAVLHS